MIVGYTIDAEAFNRLVQIADRLQGGSDRERDVGHRLWLIVNEVRKSPLLETDSKVYVWRALYDAVCHQFNTREITEAQFSEKLHALGFTEIAAKAEVALHYPPSPGRPG